MDESTKMKLKQDLKDKLNKKSTKPRQESS